MAIAVKVAHRDRVWIGARVELSAGLKGAITITEEQTHPASLLAVTDGNHDVEMTVTIEVCHRNGRRSPAYAIIVRCAKSAIWVSKKDICHARIATTCRHVGITVFIEISHHLGEDTKGSHGEKRRIKKARDLRLNGCRSEKGKQHRQCADQAGFTR